MIYKIDSHTHVGEDLVRKRLGLPYNCDPERLYEFALSSGISDVIVAPTPGQIACPNLERKNHPNFYGKEGIPKLLKLDRYIEFICICGERWYRDDPFGESNEYLFRVANDINSRNKLRFHPLPLIHPLKKSVAEDIHAYYKMHGIKGIKIHSQVDGVSPIEYINSELTHILKALHLRILFHTDNNEPSLPNDILDFAEETGIPCQLAHACRCDSASLTRASSLKNVIIDASPLNTIYGGRLLTKEHFNSYEDFIKYLIGYVTRYKVVAASDFFWCGWTKESYEETWRVFEKLNDDRIIGRNAAEFWGIQ
jgi:hypothetical protein